MWTLNFGTEASGKYCEEANVKKICQDTRRLLQSDTNF